MIPATDAVLTLLDVLQNIIRWLRGGPNIYGGRGVFYPPTHPFASIYYSNSKYDFWLTMIPATDAVLTILPPFPPFLVDIRSTATKTPRVAPTLITSKHFSQPNWKNK